jgi:hypothetical protein
MPALDLVDGLAVGTSAVSAAYVGTAQVYGGAPTAPSFVAGSTSGASSTSHTIPVPTGVANGDRMFVAVNAVDANVTQPVGWTLLDETAGAPPLSIWQRTASSEPANYSWTTAAATRAVCVAYRGTSGVDTHGFASGSSTTPTGASVTTTVDVCRLIAFIRTGANVTWTPPADMDLRVQSPTTGAYPNGAWDEDLLIAGPTGTRAFTASSSAAWSVAMVAIKP